MRALTGELLLAAWDAGTAEHDLERALTMLSLALPESSREQLVQLPIAERNVLLLRLREMSFGPVLQGFCACPRCGAQMEVAMRTGTVLAQLESQLPADPVEWSERGVEYRCRPVRSIDLLATLEVADIAEAQDLLLARCLGLSPESAMSLSPETLTAAREKFEQLHSGAELSCSIQCAECSASATLDLDVARYVWLEVSYAARRLLGEIHELAGAYGWSEQAIARMSPQRRNAYREMLSL
jgi:hypothetical protein